MVFNFREFIFENNNFNIDVAINGNDPSFLNDLIDNLSLIYKKRKERYLRPVKIVGDISDNIELRINMSNKDIIKFKFDNNELKISINNKIVYNMDDLKKSDIINKILKFYKKHIEEQDFSIVNKKNPF